MDDKLDFLEDQRRYPRFKSSAFLGVPVQVKPLPPFFGNPTKGQLVDLSAGGMAVLIEEMIPKDTKLQLELTFPDHSVLESKVRICYAVGKEGGFLIGLEFKEIPDFMREKISRMTGDFLDCEKRIRLEEKKLCRLECAFFNICDKPQKTKMQKELDTTLHMKLEEL